MASFDECSGCLSGGVTEAEVHAAIRAGRVAAAPGPGGLHYGFYQAFEHLLGASLTIVVEALLRGPEQPGEKFLGGLLRAKGGDLTLLKNWRPITLSNVDYRLVARVLLVRLAEVVGQVVHPGQTSAIPGRRMVHHMC
ncbi:hypothetical protein lerEdw1_014520 [Lerista edwardsae]|nr:hypothetical protein lerEdw1_014520 [Lerista edwardsae]